MSKKKKNILFRLLFILGGLIIIVFASYGAVKANDFWQVKQLVKASDDLVNQEKYQDALDKLNLTQARWTTSRIRQSINTKIDLDKKLLADQDNYTKGNDLFGQSKWQEAKDSYSKISNTFPHYPEAQDKIKECQNKIDEANALAQQKTTKQQQSSQRTTATSDPFPSYPDLSQCGPNQTLNIAEMECRANLQVQYEHDKEAWYARHGQSMPQTQTPTHTNCQWNPLNGLYGGWECTSN